MQWVPGVGVYDFAINRNNWSPLSWEGYWKFCGYLSFQGNTFVYRLSLEHTRACPSCLGHTRVGTLGWPSHIWCLGDFRWGSVSCLLWGPSGPTLGWSNSALTLLLPRFPKAKTTSLNTPCSHCIFTEISMGSCLLKSHLFEHIILSESESISEISAPVTR